jgi:hypothetical protein
MELGLSLTGNNTDSGSLRIGCLKEYLGLRGLKWQKAGKIFNEELHNLYSSLNIIRMITSRNKRWVEHIERVGRCEMHTEYWLGSLSH